MAASLRSRFANVSKDPCLAKNFTVVWPKICPFVTSTPSLNENMIAPITGKLRKHFWLDVGWALGLGIAGGYAYW